VRARDPARDGARCGLASDARRRLHLQDDHLLRLRVGARQRDGMLQQVAFLRVARQVDAELQARRATLSVAKPSAEAGYTAPRRKSTPGIAALTG
jgi:hypothetical protein